MQQLYAAIYRLPIIITVLIVAVIAVVWREFCKRYLNAIQKSQKSQSVLKRLLAVIFFLWMLVVWDITILSRESGKLEVYLYPLHQLITYFKTGQEEMLRTLWMNILLFFPGGLLLQALWPLPISGRRKKAMTVFFLSVFSIIIEMIQYRYALGCVETDDVVSNVLGAMLGAAIQESAMKQSKTNYPTDI